MSRRHAIPTQEKTPSDFDIIRHDSKLPIGPFVDMDLSISTTHTVIPNIGGLIHRCSWGLPCTEEAAQEESRARWVVVHHPRGMVAVTIQQALKMGLREAQSFDESSPRYTAPLNLS